MYERETERLQKMIEESESIVFFGGAGVSTESGIPDFRSADGIYHQKYRFSPEQVVSHTFFMRYPEAFYEFYKEIKLNSQTHKRYSQNAQTFLLEQIPLLDVEHNWRNL